MKILNLYAGIGGNRKLWKNADVTAVEINKKIADVYSSLFPNDKIIIDDAHEFLLKNYNDFDFIWSSPPCQSHSSFRYNLCVRYRGTQPKYPDLKLYEEIVFLKYHHKGRWVVENVKPYYEPLIKGKLIQRHLFWSNFEISDIKVKNELLRKVQIPQLEKMHDFDLSKHNLSNKRQVLRNCVNSELGLHVFRCACNQN